MKVFKNKKGFTLVELLVAISIMGIIMLIALPQISNIQQSNKKTKYKKYAESMLSSGKLYTDAYTEDMFGNNQSGCVDITYNEMKEKDLLKEIKIDGSTCNSSDTFIRVRKSNNHYSYETSVYCTDKNGKVVYEDTLAGACSEGPDEDGPIIEFDSNGSDWTKGTGLTTKILLYDDYGLLENAKIQYAWFKSGAIQGEWTTKDFQNKRYEGTSKAKLSVTVTVPQGVSGQYVLKVKPVDVRDSNGNWLSTTAVSNPFKLDNTKPNCGTNNGSNVWTASNRTVSVNCSDSHSGCVRASYSTTYNSGTTITDSVTISDKVGNTNVCPYNVYVDKEAPTTPTSGSIGTVSGKNPSASIKTAASGSADVNSGSGLSGYRYLVTNTSTKPTDKSKFTTSLAFTRSCGTSYYGWAIAVDNVGNTSAVYSLGSTSDAADVYDTNWSTCTKKCGTGYQYKYNTCALKDTLSQKCNEQTCCSKTANNTCGNWTWSPCTATCDGGTKYQYRDCTLKSAYDGSSCPGTKRETQNADTACGTDPCEIPVNETQYSGCDSYYITTCTTSTCKYSKKNGAAESGTIEKAKLANQIGSNCNITYCSSWISGSNGGTTVYYTVSNMEKCALTSVYAGDSCSKSNVGTYSFNASFSGVTVQKDAGGCGFQVTFKGPLARPNEGKTSSWRTYRCDTNWFCTSWCGESNTACAGSPS